ncbi:MFS transporter [Streptomyces sp. NPDC002659]|uniref:MFS transporter n=1 Tax=Streptomyces sp. NPDC002659 TaxID=3364656 RepID=UPI0036798851
MNTRNAGKNVAGEPTAGPEGWGLLGLLAAAQLMLVLDVTVANVALPDIGTALGLAGSRLAWVITAYSVCFGGLLMLGGKLTDVLGGRRMLLAGLFLFTAASLASGLATDGAALIGARAVQGVGAAVLSPAALSIVMGAYQGARRNRALGIWAAIGAAGAGLGVMLGGMLTSGPGWRWAFFINVPIGIALLIVLRAVAPSARPVRGTARPDVLGALAVTGAASLLIYGMVQAGSVGWGAPSSWVSLLASAALTVAFVLVEHHAAAPLLSPALMRRRALTAGGAVMVGASGILLGGFFLSSLYLQRQLGLSAMTTGMLFMPVTMATMIGAHLSANVIPRFGWRPIAAAGFALAGAGALLLTRLPAHGDAKTVLLPGFMLIGLGAGAGFVCATMAATAAAASHESGTVSAWVNTGHELGGAIGIGAASALALTRTGTASPVVGYHTAFLGAAILALAAAVVAPLLLPAGRPDPASGPIRIH